MPPKVFVNRPSVRWFLLGLGTGSIFLAARAAPPTTGPAANQSAPAPAQVGAGAAQPAGQVAPGFDPTLAELATERYQTATRGYQYSMATHQPGDVPGYEALDWMRRRVRARLDLPVAKKDKVAFVRDYVDQLKTQEDFEQRMAARGSSTAQALLRIRYDRLEAEMLLRSEQRK